jgi:hypothetical protein
MTAIAGYAVILVMTISTAATAQTVTEVPTGDKVIISDLGEIRLAGIRSTDERAIGFGSGTVVAA